MKNIRTLTALFILTFALTSTLPAQEVNGKFGLKDKNGKVILEQIYDEVSQPYKYWPVFIYRKDKKVGLYNFSDSTLYPCVYDEVHYDSRGYVIRQGDKYGFFTGDWNCYKNCGASVITPQFDAVVFNDNFISVKKDGLYGAYSTGMNPVLIVPFIANNYLHADYPVGYYYINRDNKVMLRYDTTTGVWNKTEVLETAITYAPFLIECNREQAMTIYDCKTAKKISYFPPPAPGVTRQFNLNGMFVETIEKIGELTRHTWYDPYTTKPFFTHDIEEGDELCCISLGQTSLNTEAYLVSIQKEKRRGAKYIDLGLMHDYYFNALKKPHVRRIHRPLFSFPEWHIEWFWSGR